MCGIWIGVSLRILIGEISFVFGTKRISVNILNAKVIVALNLVIQLNDTDTSAEQAVKFLRVFVGNRYVANPRWKTPQKQSFFISVGQSPYQ